MSKGIAIETILYLLIGVLVVGIVVYLVYTYVMNPVLPQIQCRALATSWCTNCKNVNFASAGPEAPSDLKKCGGTYWPPGATWNNCADGPTITFCSQCCGIS